MSTRTESRMARLAACLLVVGLLFGTLSVATYAAFIDTEHSDIQKDVAVVAVKIETLEGRVENIEGRLFSIFMAVGGVFFSSLAGTVFSFMTNRTVRNGNR